LSDYEAARIVIGLYLLLFGLIGTISILGTGIGDD
jgi:hypothetical protein